MQKKILFTFLLAVIIICIFTIDSYASYTYDFTFKDKEIDLPDVQVISERNISADYSLLFYDKSKQRYWFLVSDKPFTYTNAINNNTYFYMDINEGYYIEYIYSVKDKKWSRNQYGTAPFSKVGLLWAPENALYSNYDVYFNDEILIPAYVGSPLVKSINQITTMDTVTSEIISILPVTLTITVGLIGIRKAIAFIKNKIRKA